MKSAESIAEAIESLIKNQPSSTSKATQQFIAAEVASGSSKKEEEKKIDGEIVCEGDVCYRKESAPKETKKEVIEETEKEVTEEETEEQRQEKIRHAMKIIGEKRAERIKEEEKLEREREIKRRKEGQEIQRLKEWQNEQELKQLKDERMKEKQEAKLARQRVLDQIAQDKKERAQRFQQFSSESAPTSSNQTKEQQQSPQPTVPPNSTRIQFKKPDGDSEIVTFDSDMLFADVHAFVKNDLLQGTNIKNFSLATTFPRYEFTEEDFNKTLIDLKLVPSSVILIIPKAKVSTVHHLIPSGSAVSGGGSGGSVLPQNNGNFFDMISALIMGLFSPVFALFAYVGRLIGGNRNNNNIDGNDENVDRGKRKKNEEILTPNDAAKRRNLNSFLKQQSDDQQQQQKPGTSGTYKRTNVSSNIHRLHQESDSDDDERKTWNGNSTQQM